MSKLEVVGAGTDFAAEAKAEAKAATEAVAKLRFRRPIVVSCLEPTGILTGTSPPGASAGTQQVATREVRVRCETVGDWEQFVMRLLRRELIPMPPLIMQLVPMLAELVGPCEPEAE